MCIEFRNYAYAWARHYAINRAYTTNGLNQYTAVGAVTPTYDARGNTQEAGGWQYYSYSSENMLTASWSETGLNYDPLLRLWEIGASGTRMLYDGATLIGEYNSSHVAQRRYVHGPGVDEPLVRYDGTGTSTRRFYHADERGSIVATSDSSGAMANINSYDEYGIPGSGNAGRFQYTGQQWLSEIRMYHYRARIYSPTLGRFMQTDPIGYAGGMNLHAYVTNDPVNLVDPNGTDTCVATNFSWYNSIGQNVGPAGTEFSGCSIFNTFMMQTVTSGLDGGGGGGGDAGPTQQEKCDALVHEPGAVHVSGSIMQGTAAIGYGYMSGTVTNLTSGHSASFGGTVLTGGASVGLINFTASFTNYAGFSGGWDFSAAFVAQLGVGVQSSIRDYSGNRVGEVDLGASPLAVPIGALGIQASPINQLTQC